VIRKCRAVDSTRHHSLPLEFTVSAFLHRLGGSAAAHPWRTVAAWVLLLAVTLGLAAGFGGDLHDDYDVPGTPSQAGVELLREEFPASAGTDARVVVRTPSGTLDPTVVAALSDRLAAVDHVVYVAPPRVSADGDTALLTVAYDVPVTELGGAVAVDALDAAAQPSRDTGLTVELGGQVPENVSAPSGTAELIGVGAALVILLLAFGPVVAAGLPLAVAGVGLGVGAGLIGLLAAVTDVSPTAPTIASMVGIGVGVDYALLLVTRHVEGLQAGLDVVTAAARATATAGLSVVFAGATVLVSLLGLRLAGLPVYSSFGYATGLVVLAVMLTSVTLVPALCGLAGRRALPRRTRRRPSAAAPRVTATERWARRVGRRPVAWAFSALVLLLALAAPTLDMRTWPQDAGSHPESTTTRRAYDLVTSEFGPGANGPFLLAADLDTVGASGAGAQPWLERTVAGLAADPAVALAVPGGVSADGDAALVVLEPTTGPQDEATSALVDRLRADLPDGVHVTGLTPAFKDISDRLADRLWLVVAFVVGLSMLLLVAVFRSVVVAVKAAVMNLLSVAAAYGVMTAVFQWGWGAELLGLPHAVPVSSWVPILMFAVLFGLSMDYEVFLLSRVREDWLATGDPRGSVVRGLARTGRVITSAAAIMVAVFVGFALDPDVIVKMMGVGMATAVLVDATVVRMVLVPSTMALLGRANWWMPAWLDRLVPHLDVEGHDANLPAAAPAQPRDDEREPVLVR
jgi:putative drug exporter of the RND superfamily